MSNNYLRFPPSPSLPLAPQQWGPLYQDQYSNVLRLYFNQLSNNLGQLGSRQGGRLINFPHGAFHQDGTTTLTTGISNTSTADLQVASTTDFPLAGWVLIGSEIIRYTSKTATTFAGITRGVFSTTNTSHSAGSVLSEVQGVTSPTTAGTILLNFTDYSNGVYTADNGANVYFDNAGIYNIQVSAQLLNYSNATDNVTMWFVLNGTDIPYSASIEEVGAKHGSGPGASILTYNIFQEVAAGDYITLRWSSNTGNTVVATYPAGTSPVHPVSPAIILTANFVSSSLR
jgi:hypothetical protein